MSRKLKRLAIISAIAAMTFPGCIGIHQVFAEEAKVKRETGKSKNVVGTLQNGMKYILLPTNQDSGISVRLLIQVGRGVEKDGESQFSHLIEHAAFSNSKNFPGLSGLNMIKEWGGQYQGFTGPWATWYQFDFPSPRRVEAARLIDYLSDIASNAIMSDDHISRQRVTILAEGGERRNPPPEYQIAAALLGGEMLRYDELTMEVMKSVRSEDVERFYRKWYQPQRAVLIVSGNLSAADFELQIKRAFSNWTANTDPVEKPIHGNNFSRGKAAAKIPRIGDENLSVWAFTVNYGVYSGNRVAIIDEIVNDVMLLRYTRVNDWGNFPEIGQVSILRSQQFDDNMKMTGIQMSSQLSDPRDVGEAFSRMGSAYQDLKDNGISQLEFDRSRDRIYGRLFSRPDNRFNLTDEYSAKYEYPFSNRSALRVREKLSILKALKLSDINSYISYAVGDKNLKLAVLGPREMLDKVGDERAILAAFERGKLQKFPASEMPKPLQSLTGDRDIVPVTSFSEGASGETIVELDHGRKLVIIPSFSGRGLGPFQIAAVSQVRDVRSLSALGNDALFGKVGITFQGVERNPEDVERYLGDRELRGSLFIGENYSFLRVSARPDSPEAAFEAMRVALRDQTTQVAAAAKGRWLVGRKGATYAQRQAGGASESISSTEVSELLLSELREFEPQYFIISGNIEAKEVERLTWEYLSDIPPRGQPSAKLNSNSRPVLTGEERRCAPKAGYISGCSSQILPVDGCTQIRFPIMTQVVNQMVWREARERAGATYRTESPITAFEDGSARRFRIVDSEFGANFGPERQDVLMTEMKNLAVRFATGDLSKEVFDLEKAKFEIGLLTGSSLEDRLVGAFIDIVRSGKFITATEKKQCIENFTFENAQEMSRSLFFDFPNRLSSSSAVDR